MTTASIVPVDHRETLRSTSRAVDNPRWDSCACWSQEDHIPTHADCSDLQHATTRLAADAARTTALQHAAELVHSVFGWLSPADGRRLVEATSSLAIESGRRHE